MQIENQKDLAKIELTHSYIAFIYDWMTGLKYKHEDLDFGNDSDKFPINPKAKLCNSQ